MSRSIVSIEMAIYHPGMSVTADRLRDEDTCGWLWLTPENYPVRNLRNGSPYDCVSLIPERERDSPIIDYIFDRWAVAFEFTPVFAGGVYAGEWASSYVNAIEYEIWQRGIVDTFMPDIESLIEALDPAIVSQDITSYEYASITMVRALTAWQVIHHKSWTDYGYEYDTEVYFDGLVTGLQITANEPLTA